MTDLPKPEHALPEQPPRSTYTFASAPTSREAQQVIGACVRAARIAANMTQEDLAGTLYSKSYISAVERGKMTPSLQALRILAARLGVPISYFLGEHSSPQQEEQLKEEQPKADEAPETTLTREAQHLLYQGRHEEAIALFEHNGQKERISFAHEQYACFLAEQGRYQEAYEQMRLALQKTAP